MLCTYGILHLLNMVLRYRGSKGVRAYRQEDGSIGNLAVTRHLEESASHHNTFKSDSIINMYFVK